MRQFLTITIVTALLWTFSPSVSAATAAASASKPASPNMGLEVAKTLTMITGVAISPLLGVGAVGAWTYYGTPKEKRDSVSWYAKPAFWLPALLVVGLVFLKDTAGAAIPDSLKMPLDVLETVESKVSGLVAAGAFVPLIANFFPSAGASADFWQASGVTMASIDLNSILNVLLKPFAMIAFVIVWLAGHAINILILLSPFTTVDLALKGFRTFLLSLVVGTHFVNNTVGVIFALGVLLFAVLIAGWSFRVAVFGGVYCWDFFTLRYKRFTPDPTTNWMFTAGGFAKLPIRTYGKLTKQDDGSLTFDYKPWLVLPPQTVKLAPGEYAVGQGLFLRRVLRLADNDESIEVLTLPPRYRNHEAELARIYRFGPEREIGLLKAIMSVGRCFLWLFGAGGETSVGQTKSASSAGAG